MMSNNISARFIVDQVDQQYTKRDMVGSQKFSRHRLSVKILKILRIRLLMRRKGVSEITGIIVSDFAYGLITERIL